MRPFLPSLLCCTVTLLAGCRDVEPPTAPLQRIAPNAPQLSLIVSAITDVGSMGGTNASAGDINDFGQIVGSSTVAADPSRAFLWENGATTELFAYDMNAYSSA